MVSLSTLKTLIFTLGPLLLPRIISYFRTVRTKSLTSPVPIRPTPSTIIPSLNILFISTVLFLLSTLPHFSPPNIFTLTSSRILTPNDVLFTRLSLIHPNAALTPIDELLRPRLASLDARCLYLTYGPSVLAHCPFCNSDSPSSYLYYALPSLLLPHILHLFALGLATSGSISGKEGSRWRTTAVIVGTVLAAGDLYLLASYDFKANARAARAEDLVHFHWRMRTFRGIAIAIADVGLAGLLWAAATNRMFVVPPSVAERMEGAMRVLESVRGRLGAVGIVRNVVVRDEGLRRKGEVYWKREGQVMAEVMDEREVVEGISGALGSGRVQVATIEEEARKYAEGIVGGIDGIGVLGAETR